MEYQVFAFPLTKWFLFLRSPGPFANWLDVRRQHPRRPQITAILYWEAAAFRPSWAEVSGVGWFEEVREWLIIGSADPGNFDEDAYPEDAQLRAFFGLKSTGGISIYSHVSFNLELWNYVRYFVPQWTIRVLFARQIFFLVGIIYRLWYEGRRGAFPSEMNASYIDGLIRMR